MIIFSKERNYAECSPASVCVTNCKDNPRKLLVVDELDLPHVDTVENGSVRFDSESHDVQGGSEEAPLV